MSLSNLAASARTLYCALLVLSIASCGFALRERPTLPPEMSHTFISSDDRQSLFYRTLRDELLRSGVRVVDSPLDATATLTILKDETGQRVLSVSARNIPREYEVFYSVIYRVENDTGVMYEPDEQTRTQDYTYDETLVLGKAREEELIRQAIAGDLVRVVMFQLAAL